MCFICMLSSTTLIEVCGVGYSGPRLVIVGEGSEGVSVARRSRARRGGGKREWRVKSELCREGVAFGLHQLLHATAAMVVGGEVDDPSQLRG